MEAPIGDPADPLVAALAAWAQQSPRLAAFVADNSGKIRKKIRTAGDAEARASVRFELAAARALLHERRIALAYEPLAAGRQRGPDFSATFKSHLPFGVEATHLRSTHRFGDAVASKLRQLLPQQSNLLVVGSDEPPADLAQAMAQLKLRAENRDETLFARSGLRDPSEFFKHWGRLSALAILPVAAAAPFALWHNSQAARPLPNDLRAALLRCLQAYDPAA